MTLSTRIAVSCRPPAVAVIAGSPLLDVHSRSTRRPPCPPAPTGSVAEPSGAAASSTPPATELNSETIWHPTGTRWLDRFTRPTNPSTYQFLGGRSKDKIEV